MLQVGYLEVNRGSGNRTGWNSVIGSFMISKSKSNIRIMEKYMRCDDVPNICGRGRYRNLAENMGKKTFIRKISSVTEKHKHNIRKKNGVKYVYCTHLA
jgi:hypothetical protein